MVGVSHHPNAHPLAGFVLELGSDFVPHRRNLIPHQNVIGLESLSLIEQRFQLSGQFCPLLLQSLQSDNLLLERRTHAGLLARCLVESCQLRQLAGMIRVDLRQAFASLDQCALSFANPGMDCGNVLLNRSP